MLAKIRLRYVLLIATLLSNSGCAVPGDTLHMLYNDVGRIEFEHLEYTQARISDSHLFLEIKMRDDKGKNVQAWTSFPWTGLSRLKPPSVYDPGECYRGRPGLLFSIYAPQLFPIRNPATPSHLQGFGFDDFSSIEIGGLPQNIVRRTTAISLSHHQKAERDPRWTPSYRPIEERLDFPATVKRLTSVGNAELVSELRGATYLLAVPENGDGKPRSVYVMSGSGLCRERYARREWWSYPVMIVGTPIAFASDVVLVPIHALRVALLGTLEVVRFAAGAVL